MLMMAASKAGSESRESDMGGCFEGKVVSIAETEAFVSIV